MTEHEAQYFRSFRVIATLGWSLLCGSTDVSAVLPWWIADWTTISVRPDGYSQTKCASLINNPDPSDWKKVRNRQIFSAAVHHCWVWCVPAVQHRNRKWVFLIISQWLPLRNDRPLLESTLPQSTSICQIGGLEVRLLIECFVSVTKDFCTFYLDLCG